MLSIFLAILIISTLLGIPALASEDDPKILKQINEIFKERDRLSKDYKDIVRDTSIEYKKLRDGDVQAYEQRQKIAALERERIANAQELLTQQEKNVLKAEDNYQKHLNIIKAREKELELAAEEFGVGSKQFEQAKRRFSFAEKEAKKSAERLKTENKIKTAQDDAAGVVTGLAGKYLGLAKSFKETAAGKALDSIETIGLTGALEKMAEQAAETFTPMNIMASIGAKVAESTKAMIIATDSAISSFRRSTGAGEEMNDVLFQARIDSANVGATMAQTAEAAGALYNGMRQFSELSEEAQTELVAFATTMENLGVSSAATAEFMNNASAAMGMNKDQSMAAQRELAAAGVALGMAPGEMMEGFNQAFPQLAAHGEDAVDVFKGIAAAAKATGASMNTLLGVFGQAMDTFEGTAEVAGRVNAVLGNDLLNSVDLLNASEDERIRMMIEAIELSGRSYDAMGRFERRALANAAGISDMAEANRIFGQSLSAYDEQQRQARESGMTQEQLEERAAAATSAMEKLQAVFESMAIAVGPLISAFHGVMNTILAIQNVTGGTFVPILFVLGGGIGVVVQMLGKAIPAIKLLGTSSATTTGFMSGLRKMLFGTSAASTATASTAPPAAGGISLIGQAAKLGVKQILAFGAAMLMASLGIAAVVLAATQVSGGELLMFSLGLASLFAVMIGVGAIVGSVVGGLALAVGVAAFAASLATIGLALMLIRPANVEALNSLFDGIGNIAGLGGLAGTLSAVASGIAAIAMSLLLLPVVKSMVFNATLQKMTEFSTAVTPDTVTNATGLVDTIKQITEIKMTAAIGTTLMLGTLTKLVEALNARTGAAAGAGAGAGQRREVVLELDRRQLGRAVVDLLEDRYSLRT